MSEREAAGRSVAFRIRVAVLSTILAGLVIYGVIDWKSRRDRHAWRRTLDVAVVLVRVAPLDASAETEFATRLSALEDRLDAERARYMPAGPRPFRFTLFGPVDGASSPVLPDDDGIASAARHAWDLYRYTRDIDERAGVSGRFDSRIYVAARPPADAKRKTFEGDAEQGGRVGTVTVELDAAMVDLALTVVAHELFHTLGATDKYDAGGRALDPQGFVEPDLEPRLPQRFVEVMARGRPVSSFEEALADGLEELGVGPATAAEIGWSSPR